MSKISEGGSGSVSRAYCTRTNEYVACKTLDDIDKLINEETIFIMLNFNKNIIRFLGGCKDDMNNKYYLITEYADGGDLQNYLRKYHPSLIWSQRLILAFQITKGLRYLHSKEIIHCDLHDKNVVIKNGNAKIIDFGNAESVNTQTKFHNGPVGVMPYLAPELLNGFNNISYCKKMDIYSLGMLFWVLTSGHRPFEDQLNSGFIECVALHSLIIQGKREEIIPGTSQAYVYLYCRCWDDNPNMRPNIESVYHDLKILKDES
ncbi:24584_t:CDS:2 [Cetraspora pellucida]|uniref:24584_t:CDS:1 n=1 Tax=Cetraspora pellucida TaxID=1433469 RepID=A0A9N9DQ85_9GLOM|nr:24584_t:CDS:2 [Cetraspora pellucida]